MESQQLFEYFRSVPPLCAGLVALRTHLHKTPSATPLFSHSCKRVRKMLKTRNFNSLCFHTHAHSFAVSPLFATHTQNTPGVYVPTVLPRERCQPYFLFFLLLTKCGPKRKGCRNHTLRRVSAQTLVCILGHLPHKMCLEKPFRGAPSDGSPLRATNHMAGIYTGRWTVGRSLLRCCLFLRIARFRYAMPYGVSNDITSASVSAVTPNPSSAVWTWGGTTLK